MKLTGIVKNWEDGLISTSEALTQILCHDSPVGDRMEAIATVTLRLAEQEQAEADNFAAKMKKRNKL